MYVSGSLNGQRYAINSPSISLFSFFSEICVGGGNTEPFVYFDGVLSQVNHIIKVSFLFSETSADDGR